MPNKHQDDLNSARGIFNALWLGLMAWMVLILGATWLLKRWGLLLLLLILTGCVSGPPPGAYSFQSGTVILTHDLRDIQQACPEAHEPVGCYVPITKTLYCRPWDSENCWHEFLHHIGFSHEHQ